MDGVDITTVIGWLHSYLGKHDPFVVKRRSANSMYVEITEVQRQKFNIVDNACYILFSNTDEPNTIKISIVDRDFNVLRSSYRSKGDWKETMNTKFERWLFPPRVSMSDDKENSSVASESSQAVESMDSRSNPDRPRSHSSSVEDDSQSFPRESNSSMEDGPQSLQRNRHNLNKSIESIVDILHHHDKKIDKIIDLLDKILKK